MVVPEKILMRKIKKREKVKKQLIASKQVDKTMGESSVDETERKYTNVLLFKHIYSFKLILFYFMVIMDRCSRSVC